MFRTPVPIVGRFLLAIISELGAAIQFDCIYCLVIKTVSTFEAKAFGSGRWDRLLSWIPSGLVDGIGQWQSWKSELIFGVVGLLFLWAM